MVAYHDIFQLKFVRVIKLIIMDLPYLHVTVGL